MMKPPIECMTFFLSQAISIAEVCHVSVKGEIDSFWFSYFSGWLHSVEFLS
jgi:hypothetical protein